MNVKLYSFTQTALLAGIQRAVGCSEGRVEELPAVAREAGALHRECTEPNHMGEAARLSPEEIETGMGKGQDLHLADVVGAFLVNASRISDAGQLDLKD